MTHAASARRLVATRVDDRLRIDRARVEPGQDTAWSVGRQDVRQTSDAELVEERRRGVDGTDPAQGVEVGERAEQFRLGVGVRVDASFVAIAGLIGVGMHLQRQRFGSGQNLQEVRELAGDVAERAAVVERCRAARMGAEPQLRPRLAVGLDAEQRGDEHRVAPGVVLDDAVDPLHVSTVPSDAAPGTTTPGADVRTGMKRHALPPLAIAAVIALGLSACGDDSDRPPPPNRPPM